MKKTFLLFYFIGAGMIISNAQITITNGDVAYPGYQLQMAHDTEKDTMPGSINPGPAGANQTWNFSTLLNSSVDTLTFVNPGFLPSGANFPNANLAIMNSTDGSEIYLENTPNGLFIDGAYGDPTGMGAMVITFNPTEQLADFTTTYLTSFQNTSGFDFSFPFTIIPGVDSLRIKEIKIKDVVTDGWGNVTTPLGTYPSLRNRGRVITIDTVFVHPVGPPGWVDIGPPYTTTDTVWHFSWWANGKGFPLLEFDSTTADTIKNITWLKTLPVIGGISETGKLNGVNAYPNPSTGKFIVESNGEISVYNSIGEKVYIKTSTARKTEVDLTSQADGVYFLHINTGKGIVTKKLIISK